MIIYTLIITKDGETIFSHDIALSPDQPFSKDVSEAFEVFRMNFKETRACHQLSHITAAARKIAARKFRAVLS
jgi:hypothetical protein